MLAGHSHKLLEEAARESIERIQLDRRKAPQRLKPLLAYIEENLFNPTLDVNQLKRSCGVRDNSVPIQFHSAVGRPPHGYIEDRRLETACRLLADTNLKIWQISELLGYSSIQVFSRAFSRWSGQRPTLFRKKARRDPDMGIATPAADGTGRKRFDRSLVATESLRKALDGELPYEEAKTLMGRLEELYPGQQDAEAEPAAAADDPGQDGTYAPEAAAERPVDDVESVRLKGNAHDRYQAETIWNKLNGQDSQRQQAVLEEETLSSAALFHLLIDKSREVGLNEPAMGVHTAELAIVSLEALARRSGDEKQFADLQAQGWMRLANARALAADQRGAEEGFQHAERFLEASGRRPAAEAELLNLKATLRRDQRRFLEARDLFERAHTLCPDEDHELLVRILLGQASVRFEEGNPAAAIPFLEQALPQVDRARNPLIRLAVYHNLVATYAEAGWYDKAVKLLPVTRSLSLEHGTAFNKNRFRWLEGLVSRGLGELEEAEEALLEAREAFSDLGDGFSTALVCLDIADLYSRQDRNEDLIELCASMAPLSGLLQQHREASVAMQIFQRAAEERNLTSVIVERARKALLRSQKQTVDG